ncbi:disease resistance protein RGA2-like isoform X2 [Tasmannia lanceolata]|uniref:disease resistance protein RGA2-like isoform X2 n=1 Tax=Tasmannia lanceolata TaxID=3420 RepID=UPI0040636253
MAGELVSMLLGNLSSMLQQEVGLLLGVKDEIKKVFSMFRAIRAVLHDAENRQIKEEFIREWLEKLRNVAYDMDDVLDEWHAETLRSQIEGRSFDNENHISKKVRTQFSSSLSCFKEVGFRDRIAHRIKEIRENLEEIKDEKDTFYFKEDEGRRDGGKEMSTSSLIDESKIFGRIPDKERIIRWLLTRSSANDLTVISIVGMAGIGKTALAQLVYNDSRVKIRFQKSIWVSVSPTFDAGGICKAIIESNEGYPYTDFKELHSWNFLHTLAKKTLEGKRFLIVLDDVWNEDESKWEKIKLALNGGLRGSRIIVTTRNENVAKIMSSAHILTHIHNLERLPEDHGWSLFNSRAFLEMRPRDDQLYLETIGKEIVRKCQGVPLAIEVIGRAMRSKTTESEWKLVVESEIWDLPEFANSISPALVLSYYNMPSHLKQCFAFCSVFPKNHLIEKDTLIKLWMAQGFLLFEGKEGIEKVGERYFDDLVGRSLFDDIVTDVNGFVTHCQMRGIFHDLCQSVARECYTEQCLPFVGNLQNSSVCVRHCSMKETIPFQLLEAKNLRTLLYLGWSLGNQVPDVFFHNLSCLRALDLSGNEIERLPDSLGSLKHLRYLNLSATALHELPETVSNLCLLQTLKLNECHRLEKLPQGIGKMISVRHLEIEGTINLHFLPHGIGKLSSLRTISKFIVGNESGCKIEELKDLNLIQGKLNITNLRSVLSADESSKAELEKKQHLHVLILNCIDDRRRNLVMGRDEMGRMESVFEALRPPHTNLKELQILDFPGSKFPVWIGDPVFSNLVEVVLFHFKECLQVPSLGKLPSLKILTVGYMQEVKSIDCGGVNGAFPKLEKLRFQSMTEWAEWKLNVEEGEMACLLDLKIIFCPVLKVLPYPLPYTLRKLEIDFCAQLICPPYLPPHLEELNASHSINFFIELSPNLSNVKHLKIQDFPNGLGQLKELKTLEILSHCDLTSSFDGFQHLTKLLELRIHSSSDFKARRMAMKLEKMVQI